MLIRIYRKEAELEVWQRSTSGRYVWLKTFPICRWSGQLGPKRKEGDRQAPEGFYAITTSSPFHLVEGVAAVHVCPVGAAPMDFAHNQPMILGAQQIVPGRLTMLQ
jgi:hypothetical protein